MSEILQKLHQSLKDAGYVWLNRIDAEYNGDSIRIERWFGKNGLVLIYINVDKDFIETFADWPLGTAFAEFEEGIKKHE